MSFAASTRWTGSNSYNPGVSLIVGMGKRLRPLTKAKLQRYRPRSSLDFQGNPGPSCKLDKGCESKMALFMGWRSLIGFQGAPSPCVVGHSSPTFHCCPSRRCLVTPIPLNPRLTAVWGILPWSSIDPISTRLFSNSHSLPGDFGSLPGCACLRGCHDCAVGP